MDTHSKEFKKLMMSLTHDLNSGVGIIKRFESFYLDKDSKYYDPSKAREGIIAGLKQITEIQDYFYKEINA